MKHIDLLIEKAKQYLVLNMDGMSTQELTSTPPDEEILTMAHTLRKIGAHFKSVIMLHFAQTYTKNVPFGTPFNSFTFGLIMNEHSNLVNFISLLKLQNVHSLTPMFDGKSFMVMYECKGGKHIKRWLDGCLNYQILNPESTREQVEAYLMDNK